MEIKTQIIPQKQTLVYKEGKHELNLEAICIFSAIGFFLDEDTYWKNLRALPPATAFSLDSLGKIINEEKWFQWHYSPRDITFHKALDEFTDLFETIIKEQTHHKKVILPLSGGLDSRTQAVALKQIDADVTSYSYAFEHGYDETQIAQKIASVCEFPFQRFQIRKGYLWNQLDDLAKLNQCYSDFTSPRQLSTMGAFKEMDAVFSLGHWGDVLFDSMDLPQLAPQDEFEVLAKKLYKRGGKKFASHLWNAWGLSGDFESYFESRIKELLSNIPIVNTNAKLRAFKSMYWAPRWTSVNLSIFEAQHPIALPYYDDRMCEFVCQIPEAFLSGRQLQIAYIKKRAPKLAKITWQDHRPFNLNTYQLNRIPYNLPYKVFDKSKRVLHELSKRPYVQRNWELQFLGDANKKQLHQMLLHNGLDALVPNKFINHYLDAFSTKDALEHAHAINMLLVLSKFNEHQKNA